MRVFRILLLGLGVTVGLPVGGLLLYWSIELKAVVQRTEATPERLPAAQLVEKGVPDNLYVEVTDFTFGKQVVETTKAGWAYAWLPIEPATEPENAAKYTIFLRVNVRDQAALDEFVKQARCEALVTTGLPKTSRWHVKCGVALLKANPELDWNKTLFLAEPRLTVFDEAIELSDPRLHDPLYESAATWGGGALLLFGLVSLYFMFKGRSRTNVAAGTPDAEAESQRGQLQTERPESLHAACTGGIVQRAIWYGILAGIMLVVLLVITGGAFLAQQRGQPQAAVIFVLLNLVVFLPARAAVRAFLRMFRWPTDIALCPSGVRWRQGSQQRAILWSEVAEVRREIKVIPRFHRTGIIGAMQELNNPTPPLIKDTVHITLDTGESYLMSPDLVTNYNQFAETAPRLWKEDAMKSEAAPMTAAWLKALPR